MLESGNKVVEIEGRYMRNILLYVRGLIKVGIALTPTDPQRALSYFV